MAVRGTVAAVFAGLALAVTGLAPMGATGAAVGFCTNPDCSSGTPPLRSGHWLAECSDPTCLSGTRPRSSGQRLADCTDENCLPPIKPRRSGLRLAECTNPKCLPGTDPLSRAPSASNGDIVVGVATLAAASDTGGWRTAAGAVPNQADPPIVRD